MTFDPANAEFQVRAALLLQQIAQAVNTFQGQYFQRRVMIVRDFQDQPFGKSRRNLNGQIFRVIGASADEHGVSLELDGVGLLVPVEAILLMP